MNYSAIVMGVCAGAAYYLLFNDKVDTRTYVLGAMLMLLCQLLGGFSV